MNAASGKVNQMLLCSFMTLEARNPLCFDDAGVVVADFQTEGFFFKKIQIVLGIKKTSQLNFFCKKYPAVL
jgi:1,4-dihydroxy-2-naphthoyl-CoA synthase